MRRLQDLNIEEEQARSQVATLLTAERGKIADRLREIARERAEIESEIKEKFSRYYELIKPRGLGIDEVQKLLDPNEVLVFTSDAPALLSTPEETFIIAISQKEVRWARSALGTEALKRERLLLVPSGPLTSLPFGVLVASAPSYDLPQTFEQYFDVDWLGVRNALVTLPAVSSLGSLRAQLADQPRAPAQICWLWQSRAHRRQPLLPLEQGAVGVSCHRDRAGEGCRQIRARRSEAAGGGAAARPPTSTDIRKRQEVCWSARPGAALCPLPDTEYEIACVAQRFPMSERLNPLRLQERATERDIKSLSLSGELQRYRILHFATHGLLAGDVRQIIDRDGEPALVLTPPETPAGPDDDGLLTASEVAALKLNADWVVLSACNTAAGEKIGAEALSGLARSFFYAGARSLLVSHWPVYSDAAVRLATYAFDETPRQQGRARRGTAARDGGADKGPLPGGQRAPLGVGAVRAGGRRPEIDGE